MDTKNIKIIFCQAENLRYKILYDFEIIQIMTNHLHC